MSASATHTRCRYCYLPDHPRHVRPADYPLPYAQAAAAAPPPPPADAADLGDGADDMGLGDGAADMELESAPPSPVAASAAASSAAAPPLFPPAVVVAVDAPPVPLLAPPVSPAAVAADLGAPSPAVASVVSASVSTTEPAPPVLDLSSDLDPSSASAPLGLAADSGSAAAAAPAGPPLLLPAAMSRSALLLSAAPLVAYESSPEECWQHYRYALYRATDYSRQLARDLAALFECCPSGAEIIAGGVHQYNMGAWSVFQNSKIQRRLNDLFRLRLGDLGVKPPEAGTPLCHLAQKMLAAPSGKGLQAIHWDALNGPWDAVHRTSVVFYTTDGAQTTAMPRWPWAQFQPADTKESKKAFAWMLSRDYFHSVPAHPGDIMIFSQRVPHYGTPNPTAKPRQALFSMFSPFDDESQDARQVRTHAHARSLRDHRPWDRALLLPHCLCVCVCVQLFRWRYMEEAFGTESLEFAESLVADAAIRPLSRYTPAGFRAACRSLLDHQLADAFCAAVGHNGDAAAVRKCCASFRRKRKAASSTSASQ